MFVLIAKTVYDYDSLKELLENAGFKNIHKWDWRTVEHGHIDDYSQAYLPHMDKENGPLLSGARPSPSNRDQEATTERHKRRGAVPTQGERAVRRGRHRVS